MSSSTPFKGAPSFKSPRTSPFRRPESPSSPSPLRNAVSPEPKLPAPVSPTKPMTPSKLNNQISPPSDDKWTPPRASSYNADVDSSPTKGASNKTAALAEHFSPPPIQRSTPLPVEKTTNTNTPSRFSSPLKSESIASTPATTQPRPSYGSRAMSESNALSKLQPSQVRELREGFQILDRDNDGQVNEDDVRDMLQQLGLPETDLSAFFPPDKPTMSMAAFLTQISTLLSALSPGSELLNAFSAFDDDDSGQVDLAELRETLLTTQPEKGVEPLRESEVDRVLGGFSGRRAFGRQLSGKRGEVFKYGEFVSSVGGKGEGKADQ